MIGNVMVTIRRWALPLLVAAGVMGIAIGLLLAWYVWPVRWYNTDPADLRVQHQEDYVIMTADSLAVTGNMDLAKRRLHELVDDDTSLPQVANLVERVAVAHEQSGDGATALRVRRMALAVGLPAPTQAQYQPPTRRIISPPRSVLIGIGLAGLLLLVAFAVLMVTRLSKAPPAQQSIAVFDSGDTEPEASAPQPSFPFVRRAAEAPWDESAMPENEEETPADFEPETEMEEPDEEHPTTVIGRASRALPRAPTRILISDEPEETLLRLRAQAHPLPKTRGASEAPSSALGTFEASYTYGDDDYDRSFSIESPTGEFLGECGMGIADVLGAEAPQQVDAFEVWLFDKGDIRAVSKTILVSEYAFHDQELNAQLAAKGELLMARTGLAFTLETRSLRVAVTVAEMDYVEDAQAQHSFFERMRITLVAQPNTGQPA